MGLQQIQRHFLWGRGYLERKSYLVKWASICLDKKNGRLGVKRFDLLNKTLLTKWI